MNLSSFYKTSLTTELDPVKAEEERNDIFNHILNSFLCKQMEFCNVTV